MYSLAPHNDNFGFSLLETLIYCSLLSLLLLGIAHITYIVSTNNDRITQRLNEQQTAMHILHIINELLYTESITEPAANQSTDYITTSRERIFLQDNHINFTYGGSTSILSDNNILIHGFSVQRSTDNLSFIVSLRTDHGTYSFTRSIPFNQ